MILLPLLLSPSFSSPNLSTFYNQKEVSIIYYFQQIIQQIMYLPAMYIVLFHTLVTVGSASPLKILGSSPGCSQKCIWQHDACLQEPFQDRPDLW